MFQKIVFLKCPCGQFATDLTSLARHRRQILTFLSGSDNFMYQGHKSVKVHEMGFLMSYGEGIVFPGGQFEKLHTTCGY